MPALPPDTPAHHQFPGVSFAALRIELAAEAQRRAVTYPRQIAKARMTPAEAARQQALLADIAADLEAVINVAVPARMAAAARAAPAFSWSDKRNALKREITLRRRWYPAWIADGSLDPDEAAHRLACFQALLANYDDGLCWIPQPRADGTPLSPAERYAQWSTVAAAIAAESGTSTSQKELAL